MRQSILAATQFIQNQFPDFRPRYGIILGTGLGQLAREIDIEREIPYEQIPHFATSTVEFHKGRLLLGNLSGQPVVCMEGRFHYYEGYSMQQVTFPVRVMRELGVEGLFVSNAAGGLNPAFQTADLMILQDHISLLLPESPLRGPHSDSHGDRWPDMSDVYDAEFIEKALAIAQREGIRTHRGVYVSVPGPQLETRSEYRWLRQMGADAVGMSTVPEIIVARQMGLRCFGISVITDLCIPETLEKADIRKIIAAAQRAEPGLTFIIKHLVSSL
ncbi:MAG: purine-nucleoside phosphorylase [Cytophagaceae bacterium]|nr:purine-nucleoside phosphorylase [Cytophagaceae bacterium]